MADSLNPKTGGSASEGEFEFDNPVFSGFDLSGASDEAPVDKEEKSASGGEGEFIIPDTFGFGEEFPANDYVSTLKKPYVPRFTEVTENSNYFADQSIVRAAKEAEEAAKRRRAAERGEIPASESDSTDKQIASQRSGKGGIVVERVAGHSEPTGTDRIDPIAEIDSYIPATVVVNVNGGSSVKPSTINVFKFADGASEPVAESVDAEELERRGISDLTGHKWDENKDSSDVSDTADEVADTDSGETLDMPLDSENTEQAHVSEQSFPADYNYLPLGYEEKEPSRSKNDKSEYNSFSQYESFKDRFLDTLMATKIRLVVAILLGLCVAVFELFPGFFTAYLGLASVPNAATFIDSALIACMIVISLPELIRGVMALAGGSVTPELTSAISAIGILAYSVYVVAAVPEKYVFVGTVYAIIAVNMIISTLYTSSAAFTAFKVISARGAKTVLDCRMTRDLETHNHALDGVVDEYRSKCAKTFNTVFVSGFSKNSLKSNENSKNNIIVIAITFGIALVLSVAMLVIAGAAEAFAAFVLVIALATPAMSMLSHKLPFYYAEREAVTAGGAVVGEAAMYDYSATDVIIFEDTEVFGPDDVTLKSASDKRSTYHESMRKLSSLFNAVGGPLSVVFESALGKKYEPAADVTVFDGGICGNVDGKQIIAGTAEFMSERGISVPVNTGIKIGSTRVVYAAEDGEFFGTFTVHYSFSEEFALMLSAMKEKGIVPLVYTRDFNVNNEFMRGLTGGSDVIRVMKRYDTLGESVVLPRVSSPVVTSSDKTDVLECILRAKRYTQLQSTVSAIEIAAAAAGAALAVAVTVCKMTFALPIPLIAVWQIGWSIVLAIMSRKNFNTRKKENDDAQ